MGALLSTFPADVPGVLRRGSPVLHPRRAGVTCVVVSPTPTAARVAYPWVIDGMAGDDWALRDLVLDLSDATGRAHLAWWLVREGLVVRSTRSDEDIAWVLAERGADMTPQQIDTLARLGLRLANRSTT